MNAIQHQVDQGRISDYLNVLSSQIRTRSRMNMNDACLALEGIMAVYLNALFGWNLKNLNLISPNFPAADLGDRERGIAIQVTTRSDAKKVRETIQRAIQHGLNAHFNELYILQLVPKKSSVPMNDPGYQVPGMTIRIWDIADLVQVAGNPALGRGNLHNVANLLHEEVMGRGVPAIAVPTLKLKARFQEDAGKLLRIGPANDCSYWIDLWVEAAPSETTNVRMEVLDESFVDNPWSVTRGRGAREFLTDDFNSWGDVVIMARGCQGKRAIWSQECSLYAALVDYYRDNKRTDIGKALAQFRDN